MYNPYSLSNKHILITGAGSGIGRATAIECSKLGACCYLVGRNEARLRGTLALMDGTNHQCIVADIMTEEGLNHIIASLPQLDGVVHNAGTARTAPLAFITDDDLDTIFGTNAYAPMRLTKMMVKKNLLHKHASLVFISSMDIERPEQANSVYAASKGALTAFMRACAKELAPRQIRANAIIPGMIETSFIGGPMITEEDLQRERERYLLKRFGKPEEVAWLIIYMLSDASAFMTGSAVHMNGGISLM